MDERKEIGGYIELDTYCMPMLHEEAIALNCGRNALAYILKAKRIKKIQLPEFLCDSVQDVCKKYEVEIQYYCIGMDFNPPKGLKLQSDEWLYLVNYYGQLSNEDIKVLVECYDRVIVDNAQSYFQMPVEGVDTLYTCRKYFGVADGAFLYTDALLKEELPLDESFERIRFLLGRYERTASEFYSDYVANNELFCNEPIKKMSKLTQNLLHGIDYKIVKQRRIENFEYLHGRLEKLNRLSIKDGTFMYPFMIENAGEIRKKLQTKKIYIPTLWPNVLELCQRGDLEYDMAENILPLPIDQRYGIEDMKYLCGCIEEAIKGRE